MSDAPQGEGWWQASDGRWYPPESAPGTPPSAPPPSEPPSYGAPAPGYSAPGPAPGPGQPPSYGGAPGYGPQPGGAPKGSSRTAWIILAVVLGLLVLVCGGCSLIAWIGVRDAGLDIAEIAQEAGRDFSSGVPAAGPTSCQVTGFLAEGSDTYTVEVTVANESGINSHYQISYDLFGPSGDLLGSDIGVVSNVEAGDEVRDTNFGFLAGSIDPSDITCDVTQALRIPS